MYSTSALRKYQYFTKMDWPGGAYASPTLPGSRPGALVACAWATMMHLGTNGYLRAAAQIMASAKKIEAEIRNTMPDLEILGNPESSVVAFTAKVCSPFQIADTMKEFGWHLNQLSSPAAIHICVTLLTNPDTFLTDLRESLRKVKENPRHHAKDSAAVYGTTQLVPLGLLDELARDFVDLLYFVKK